MKSFCALVGISQLWQCVAEECSDSLGSCTAKQASLMQFKSLSRKKQALALETQGTVASKLARFEKFTDGLVAKYGQPDDSVTHADESIKPDAGTLDAVKEVLDFINGLGNSMQGYHNDDVEQAYNITKDSHHCVNLHLSAQIVADIGAAKNTSDTLQTAHTNCRDSAVLDCEASCSPNGACIEYDRYRTNQDNRDPNPASLPSCASGDESDFVDAYIRAPKDSSELTDMELCLEKTKTWLDGDGDTVLGLYTLFAECNRVETSCTSLVAKCDTNQEDFEMARETYALESNMHCENLATCLNGEDHDCQVECPQIQIRAGARAADNETGQRLVCLLENLFGVLLEEKNTAVTDDYPNGTWFGPQPSKQDRISGLEACKMKEYDTEAWHITCDCPDDQHTEGTYQCPVSGVSKSCPDWVSFANEMDWVTTVTNPDDMDCSNDAQRGAQKVVTTPVCD